MAATKEIRSKIGSIQNTQKITSAMQMVAASKMRKAQDRMQHSRPYAERIRQVVGHIASASSEYHHAYLEHRKVKRVGLIVVSSDRGLCGGLNTNLFRFLLKHMAAWEREQNIEVDLCLIGAKAMQFFKTFGGRIVASAAHLPEVCAVTDLIGTVRVMLSAYDEQKIDQLYILYNQFVNTMTQKPQLQQLVPLVKTDEKEFKHHWDYIYEPEAKGLLDGLLVRYIEAQVYQAVVENGASEQAARMVAMKNATENAGTLIDELKLIFNKARQAAITQEIAEIVGGAAAV